MIDKPYILAMDIGGTRTKYGLIDLETGQLIATLVWSTDFRTTKQFISSLINALQELCNNRNVDKNEIKAVGIGIPGFVDGDVISQVWDFLAFMEGSHLRIEIEDNLEMPVRMDNDARTVGLGEYYFGGRPLYNRFLSLTLGTGVGFAFIVNGELQERSSINHLAGHILIHPGEEKCYCGLSGCLESLVNGPKLVTDFKKIMNADSELDNRIADDAKSVFQAAKKGHQAASQAIEQLIDNLILGMNVYINLYAPNIFVLGGGLSQGLSPYLDFIQKGLVTSPFKGYKVGVQISSLSENAGLYGAASLWISSNT